MYIMVPLYTTSLGDVTYNRTIFKNKKTDTSCYLLDKLIEIEPHTKVSEDHVSLQYLEKKGDIKKPRSNTVMPRLAYVYEGIGTEKDGRAKLINAKYFGGVYDGSGGVKDFWREVNDYIESACDTEMIKHIFGTMKTICTQLDSNVRYRLRMCIWKHWKTPQNKEKNLVKLGVPRWAAHKVANTGNRIAHMCHNGWIQKAISNKRLASFGLISMLDYYTERCVKC